MGTMACSHRHQGGLALTTWALMTIAWVRTMIWTGVMASNHWIVGSLQFLLPSRTHRNLTYLQILIPSILKRIRPGPWTLETSQMLTCLRYSRNIMSFAQE